MEEKQKKSITYTIRPYENGEENYVAEAHERIYSEEYGWNQTFTDFAKQVVYDFAAAPKTDHAEMWVAMADNRLVGSIMLQEEDPGIGHLRLFLMEKAYRGFGIGSALLELSLEKAKEWGFHHLFLSTAEPLKTARKKYAAAGFTLARRELVTDWTLDGSDVWEEYWEKDL